MSTTRTGSFAIGFRCNCAWQKDLGQVIQWARDNRFAGIDVAALDPAELKQIVDSGLQLGSVDLVGPWSDLLSPDAAKRKDAAQKNAQYIKEATQLGAQNFFAVVLPQDPHIKRKDSLRYAGDGFGQLCQAIEPSGAKIVLEGWPGGAPHYAALACTPESYRAVFKEVGSQVLGVNFDPSHLVRMGIDPVRFCREFIDRIYHVHGKDTQILEDGLYEYGNLQPATLAEPWFCGGHHWRYTIPGHGVSRWDKLLAILAEAGYQGMVSIELEDHNFHGTEASEKLGLLASRDFLIYA